LERGLRFGRSSSRGRTSDWVGVLGRLWSVCFFSPHLSLGLTSRSLLVCLPSPEPDAGILNFYSPGSSPLSLSLRSSFLRSLRMFLSLHSIRRHPHGPRRSIGAGSSSSPGLNLVRFFLPRRVSFDGSPLNSSPSAFQSRPLRSLPSRRNHEELHTTSYPSSLRRRRRDVGTWSTVLSWFVLLSRFFFFFFALAHL